MDISIIPLFLLLFRPYEMIKDSLGDCKACSISLISSGNLILFSSLASDLITSMAHSLPVLGISTPPPFVIDILKGSPMPDNQRSTLKLVQEIFQTYLPPSSTT